MQKKRKKGPITRFQKHAVQDCVDIPLRLITCSDKAEQWELTVLPWEACEVHAFLLRARLPSTQTGGSRLAAITPPRVWKTPSACSSVQVTACSVSPTHLASRSWWSLWWGMMVWKLDGSGRNFCQGEEWKPRGIMGRIQAGAGNEEAIKTSATIK